MSERATSTAPALVSVPEPRFALHRHTRSVSTTSSLAAAGHNQGLPDSNPSRNNTTTSSSSSSSVTGMLPPKTPTKGSAGQGSKMPPSPRGSTSAGEASATWAGAPIPPSSPVAQAQQQGIFNKDLAYIAPRNYLLTSPAEEEAAQLTVLHTDAAGLKINALMQQVANEQRRANAALATAQRAKERAAQAEEEARALRERLKDEQDHNNAQAEHIAELEAELERAIEVVRRLEGDLEAAKAARSEAEAQSYIESMRKALELREITLREHESIVNTRQQEYESLRQNYEQRLSELQLAAKKAYEAQQAAALEVAENAAKLVAAEQSAKLANEEISMLRFELAKGLDERERLLDEVKRLAKARADMESDLSATKAALAKAQAELETTRASSNDSTQRMALLEQELNQAKTDLVRYEKLLPETIAKAVADRESQLEIKIRAQLEQEHRAALQAARADERETWKTQLEREREKSAELARQTAIQQQQRSDREQELWNARLSELVAHHNDRVAQLEQQAALKMEAAVKTHHLERMKLMEEIAALRMEVSKERTERVHLEEKFEAKVAERVHELEMTLEASLERTAAAETAARAAQHDASELSTAVEELKQTHEQEKQRYAQELEELQSKLEHELQDYRDQVAQIEMQLEESRSEFDRERDGLMKANAELQEECENLQQMLVTAQDQYKDLLSRFEATVAELDSTRSSLEVCRAAVKASEEQMIKMTAQLEKRDNTAAENRKESEAKISELSLALAKATAELAEKSSALQKLDAEHADTLDRLEELRENAANESIRLHAQVGALMAQREALSEELHSTRGVLSEKSMLLALAGRAHAIVADAVHKFAELAQQQKVGTVCLLELSQKIEAASESLSTPVQRAGHTLVQSRAALVSALKKAHRELIDCSTVVSLNAQGSEVQVPRGLVALADGPQLDLELDDQEIAGQIESVVLSECAGKYLLHSLRLNDDPNDMEDDDSFKASLVEQLPQKLSPMDQISLIFGELEALVDDLYQGVQTDDNGPTTVAGKLVGASRASTTQLSGATAEMVEAARRSASETAEQVLATLVSPNTGTPLLLLAARFIVLESRASLLLANTKAALQCRLAGLRVYLEKVREGMVRCAQSGIQRRADYYMNETEKLRELIRATEQELHQFENAQGHMQALKCKISAALASDADTISPILAEERPGFDSEQTAKLELIAASALQQLEAETNATLNQVLEWVQDFEKQSQVRALTFGEDIVPLTTAFPPLLREDSLPPITGKTGTLSHNPSFSDLHQAHSSGGGGGGGGGHSRSNSMHTSPSASNLLVSSSSGEPTSNAVSTLKELRWRLSNMQVMLNAERKLQATLGQKIDGFEKTLYDLASKVQKQLGQVAGLGLSGGGLKSSGAALQGVQALKSAAATVLPVERRRAHVLDIRLVSLEKLAVKVRDRVIEPDAEPCPQPTIALDLSVERAHAAHQEEQDDKVSAKQESHESNSKPSGADQVHNAAGPTKLHEAHVDAPSKADNTMSDDHAVTETNIDSPPDDLRGSVSMTANNRCETKDQSSEDVNGSGLDAESVHSLQSEQPEFPLEPTPTLEVQVAEPNHEEPQEQIRLMEPPEFVGVLEEQPAPTVKPQPPQATPRSIPKRTPGSASTRRSTGTTSSNVTASGGHAKTPASKIPTSLPRPRSVGPPRPSQTVDNRVPPPSRPTVTPYSVKGSQGMRTRTSQQGEAEPQMALQTLATDVEPAAQTDEPNADDVASPQRKPKAPVLAPHSSSSVATRGLHVSAAISLREEQERQAALARRLQAQQAEEEARRRAKLQQIMHREQGVIAVRGPDGKLTIADASNYPIPFRASTVAEQAGHQPSFNHSSATPNAQPGRGSYHMPHSSMEQTIQHQLPRASAQDDISSQPTSETQQVAAHSIAAPVSSQIPRGSTQSTPVRTTEVKSPSEAGARKRLESSGMTTGTPVPNAAARGPGPSNSSQDAQRASASKSHNLLSLIARLKSLQQ